MGKIWIIAKREYLERVRTKSFMFMTLLIPALIYFGTVGPQRLMNRQKPGEKHLVVVASEKRLGELIEQQLTKQTREQRSKAEGESLSDRPMKRTGNLTVDVDTDTSETHRAALFEALKQRQFDGIILATSDSLRAKKLTFLTSDVAGLFTAGEIENAVNDALRRDLLQGKGMSKAEIDEAMEPVLVDTKSPAGAGNPQAVLPVVLFAAMVLYVSVLLYGVNVMRAILDEKTSRIMEVMLATAQANELMAGKILGVATVGLTQIVIWAAMVLVPGGIVAGVTGAQGILSAKLLIYFSVFFLLGFSLYSTIYAAVGAMVNSEQEGQQLQLIVTLPMVIAVMIMLSALQNPASPVVVAASIFPLTAPLVMFLRVAISSPPLWQIGLSIALMIATIVGLVVICARIYRVGILMYGKKPTLPELMKWVRYA
jgi:ABC-2 type transport system permease protein